MAFNFKERFQAIQQVLAMPGSFSVRMAYLIESCQLTYPHKAWKSVSRLPFDEGYASLGEWLTSLLSDQPPPPLICAFWFGIYNPMLKNGKPGCDLYLSGSDRFDPKADNLDWAVWNENSYMPAGRYSRSWVLNSIYQSVRSMPDSDAALMGEYRLCMGYACLALVDLLKDIDRSLWLGDREHRYIAVGFDGGDQFNIGKVTKAGVEPISSPPQ